MNDNVNASYFRRVLVHQVIGFHVGMVKDKLVSGRKYGGLIESF